jgi:hypothetical protein
MKLSSLDRRQSGIAAKSYVDEIIRRKKVVQKEKALNRHQQRRITDEEYVRQSKRNTS